MITPSPLTLTLDEYERAAAEYLEQLPLEHFMEGEDQGIQRKIVLDSLESLKARRGNIEFFNELLVQYIHQRRLRQVCPDNMLIRGQRDPRHLGSYNIELEPAPLFLVLEYVSPNSRRKDYDDSFKKYERELEVPYCILFDPDRQDLSVFRHDGKRYEAVQPNEQGRYAIPELELHVGLFEEWLRFWHQGELIVLRPELEERLQEIQSQLSEQRKLLNKQDRQLKRREKQIEEKDKRIEELLQRLRRRVESRAQRAGRADILKRLTQTNDPAQLEQWLDELE